MYQNAKAKRAIFNMCLSNRSCAFDVRASLNLHPEIVLLEKPNPSSSPNSNDKTTAMVFQRAMASKGEKYFGLTKTSCLPYRVRSGASTN
ncbi:hypothetical protein O2N63_12065 [Aliiroseovarius sp. KMU-50]|uniref:Uncharacterized protein n=1 Tax=Aliiroseovarius salicola TaxID=3009082 RepID=A0ABT4W2T9_9RHOB|nr:hypothetical protein [Aliiroseovarius sp. KMU-50]MDA5094820.1 hypothetical protein [Aliiroseovarius sp. KMU-50]